MRFSAAIAAGASSVQSLRDSCGPDLASDDITLLVHGDLAVAWSSGCRWIDTHDDGDVLVVLDGRLHNLWSASLGQAELLLQRYQARGTLVAREVLGDFVLIILDRRSSSLVVARDPVGVRPWYTASAGRSHAGASDMAALAALPWVDTTINEPIAIQYLAAVEESRGETLLRGIRTLRPGETWHLSDGRASTIIHHRWELRPELGISWEEASARCRAVFDEAVRDRMRDSGPPTSELSGGLDSSTVVGTLALLGRDDLLAGRLIFDGPRADERPYSDAVLEHWGLPAVSVPPWIPRGDELETLGSQIRRPVPDPNFTMFASLHRAFLAEGRPDGLTGLGGDDAFLAMGVGCRVVSALQLRQAGVLAALARRSVRDRREGWSEVLRPTLGFVTRRWRGGRSARWVSDAAKTRGALPELTRRTAVRVTGVAAIDERLSSLTSGYDASILEARALVAGWSGTRESHPFLDPRFIEATYGLDPWWPTRDDHDRALEVDAFRARLPPVVARRRSKAEFSEVFWPQVLGSGVIEEVRTGPLRDLGWLEPSAFDVLVADAKRGTANAAIPLSRCVSVDHWLRSQ